MICGWCMRKVRPSDVAAQDIVQAIPANPGNGVQTVNAVAVNPVDETMAISVSDDMTVRLWRSKIQQKE